MDQKKEGGRGARCLYVYERKFWFVLLRKAMKRKTRVFHGMGHPLTTVAYPIYRYIALSTYTSKHLDLIVDNDRVN